MVHYIGNWVVKGDKMVGITPSDSGRGDTVLGAFATTNSRHNSRGPSGVGPRFVFRPDPSCGGFGPDSIKFILEHLLALNERGVNDE